MAIVSLAAVSRSARGPASPPPPSSSSSSPTTAAARSANGSSAGGTRPRQPPGTPAASATPSIQKRAKRMLRAASFHSLSCFFSPPGGVRADVSFAKPRRARSIARAKRSSRSTRRTVQRIVSSAQSQRSSTRACVPRPVPPATQRAPPLAARTRAPSPPPLSSASPSGGQRTSAGRAKAKRRSCAARVSATWAFARERGSPWMPRELWRKRRFRKLRRLGVARLRRGFDALVVRLGKTLDARLFDAGSSRSDGAKAETRSRRPLSFRGAVAVKA